MEELLVYMCSYVDKEKGEVILEQVNSYKYPFDNYYNEIEKIKEVIDEEEIEIYCIIGEEGKIENFEKEVKKIIKEMFDIILREGIEAAMQYFKEISNNDSKTSKWLYYYIQNIIKEEDIKYPLVSKFILKEEMEILCLYSSKKPEESEKIKEKVENTIRIFLEKENPYFLGKQIMLQSFLLENIKGRKIVSVLPEKNDGRWYALLEGGYKLPIDIENLYELEKISSRDIPMYTVYEIDNILKSSCYAYGKWYVPTVTFEEWNDVFLYTLATLKIEYNKENLNNLLEDFYEFIENKVCESTEVPLIIDKDTFLEATIINIENIRKYIRGLEEEGISRNILLQVKNRYAYIPILYKIIEKRYPEEVKNREISKEFKIEEWKTLIKDIEKGTNYEKGIHLEEIANYFIECIKGLIVSGRRVKLENQEIDLCCYNLSENSFLWELGTIILVECKNYEKPVETKEIRSMIYLMEAKGVNTFILFARNGITSGAQKEIEKQLIYQRQIIVITEEDLKNMAKNNKQPIEILKEIANQI